MLHDNLGHGHIQWHPPLIMHFTKSRPCYRTGPYYRLWLYQQISGGFNRTCSNGCGMPTEDADSFGHLVLFHLGTGICSNVEIVSQLTLWCLRTLDIEHASDHFFAWKRFLKESRLTISGDQDQGMSPPMRFGQGPSYSFFRFFSQSAMLHKKVCDEGTSTSSIVLPMVIGSYRRCSRCLTIFKAYIINFMHLLASRVCTLDHCSRRPDERFLLRSGSRDFSKRLTKLKIYL